ncbi:MAG: hypothetical protein NZM12_11605, partial [Steroidobacteraceae bacterium]|nr:hypothetical protein [Steroidobacteraceae bacterium]MDW8258449.1 homoserine O-acetyltransferase [Gammaproteobacteria bacterium]
GQNPRIGMRIARKLGTITYRSAVEWRQRYGRRRKRIPNARPFIGEFEVEGYLENQAEKFAGAFDANCYLYLSHAMDDFDLERHGGIEQVARRSQLEGALIIGVETDMLFRIDEQARIAAAFAAAGVPTRFERIDSPSGHDAFLADTAPFARALRAFFDNI